MITLITNGAPTHEVGIKSLVAYLQANDIPVTAIYMNYCKNLHPGLKKQIYNIVMDSKLVGFSLMTRDVGLFMPTIHEIQHRLKIPVVLGGVHPTALPKESLEFSDYVCIGEGEEPIKQLYAAILENSSFSKIPNIAYKNKWGNKCVNPVTYFIDDLDELPYPDYQFETSYYFNQVKIVKITPEVRSKCFDSLYFYSQRGCKLACTYCSNSLYSQLAKDSGNKWYRFASTKRVINELNVHLQKFPSLNNLTFNDDDFLTRSIDDLEEITSFVKDEFKLSFSINGIPTFVTEEKIKILVENGLKGIAFGVQSGSSRILKKVYKRPVPIEVVLQSANVIAKHRGHGLNADYGFILDNPYEEKEEWLETLDLIRALPKPRTISLYSLEFFPGTALTDQAIKDMLVEGEQFGKYRKDYREDIKYTFKNTILFLYSYFDIPSWINSILLSKFIINSMIGSPIRLVIGYPFGYIIRMNKKVALANRETFLPIKILKKIWVLRMMKHLISQSISKDLSRVT